MIKNLFLFICGVILLFGCGRQYECNGVKNKQYSGYGIVFYHMPVSGSNYEMIIIPTCSDTTKLTGKIENIISGVKILGGVSCNINIRDSLFTEVFKKSQKIKLLNNQTLAPQYRVAYVCPIYVEFKNAQNDTQSTTGGEQNTLHEKLVLENGQQLTLEYFLTNTLKTTNLRVL